MEIRAKQYFVRAGICETAGFGFRSSNSCVCPWAFGTENPNAININALNIDYNVAQI